ncbi:LysR family transcriptional regulator [Streptomyces echinoruber]|uniref:LysR family transcriptional regulator n=1 Tax=Streptomyces echinoruber TaxID=68898 RepID=A0A918V9A9_9ACTN|nr:LysR family transcriptional regulator [Streptomyces echinoruber]GGZ81449.1 LysR family transcriptional regulator [Streptomyces echinoruber]
MQLGWLQTFIAVCHTGSFTKAARQLGLTQPAVTQQIRGLESELGKPLFHRTPQGATPTAEGKALAHEIEASMAAINAAVSRHFDDTTEHRPIRLGGPAELVTARIVPSISEFVIGGLDIRISLGEATGLLEDLRSGHLDLVVSTVRPQGPGVDFTPLTDEEFALLASPQVAAGIPADALQADDPRVLAKLPMIAYAETLPIIRRYWRAVFDAPPPSPPAVVVPDLRAVIAAVTSSAGISVLPTYLCAAELASGTLVPLLEPEIPPINTLYLATRSGTLLEPRLARLHEHLVRDAREWT